jgi:hypothetical protein
MEKEGVMANGMTKGLLAARVLALTIAAIGVTVGPGGVATTTTTPTVTVLAARERLADRQPAVWDDDSGDDSGDDDGDSDVS